MFELLCRDFFRFLCTKHGDRIFHLEGAEGNKGSTPRKWSTDADKIARWKTGTTGQPLVDANMRELMVTGACNELYFWLDPIYQYYITQYYIYTYTLQAG